MRILLLEHPRSVNPERCNDIANTPLSSCLISGYVAGMLQARGHEVEIIEGYLDRLSYDDIAARLASWKPQLLGVHLVYHWQQDLALFEFLAQLKARYPNLPQVAYGFFATIAAPQLLQQCTALDAIIRGEAELPFSRIAEKGLTALPGVLMRDGSGGICESPPEAIEDLDAMPFPVRTPALARIHEVNILGSRGCYGRCTFCYVNSYYGQGRPWRGRSPANIVAEISAIRNTQRGRDFYFTDPNFFGPGARGQERALKIAALLKPLRIHFGIEGRVNDIHDATIAALAAAGLRHILIGLESGSDAALKRMNKLTTVAQNERALAILRRHGIEPNIGFIMFEPDSTLADLRINFEFLKRNKLLTNLPITVNVLYHHQIVLAGTQAYRDLVAAGRLEIQESGYEGQARLLCPEVARLADSMRQITNSIFQRLDGIWSGRTPPPPDMAARSAAVNEKLVECFETILHALEAEEALDFAHEIQQLDVTVRNYFHETKGRARPPDAPPSNGKLDCRCATGLRRVRRTSPTQ